MSKEHLLLNDGLTIMQRCMGMLETFIKMEDDGEVSVRLGWSVLQSGEKCPAIVIELDGKLFGFLTEHARAIAHIAEELIAEHNCESSKCQYFGFPNLIGALRRGADKAEEHFRKTKLN